MRYLLLIVLIVSLAGCRTTEANYRSAYERAKAGRDSATAFENTIYGASRQEVGSRRIVADGDTAMMRTFYVAVTPEGGGVAEWLHSYNVVVGQYKQKFNAFSMRERLAEGGYPRSFVVNTGEPYYYVVLSSHRDGTEALKALRSIPAGLPVAVKSPCPFILQAARVIHRDE